MIPFLKETALDVLEKYGDNFHNLNFVFQNKRAGVYFKQYLGQVLGRTIWAPNIYEMQSLCKKFTGFTLADDLSLIFDLYSAFAKTKTQADADALSFYEFYNIGEIILRDFIDIDSNLVDVKQIFRNIRDLKEIDSHFDYFTEDQKEAIKRFWSNFNTEQKSVEKEKFLHLWNKLPEMYTVFTEKLLKEKAVHTGLLFREVADKVKDNSISVAEGEKYIFIGFNALNAAQEKLFKFMERRGSADFFWDADKYYVDDENQEAGLFLRQNFEKFPNRYYKIPNNLDPNNKRLKQNNEAPVYEKGDKKINLIGVSLEVGQAKLIPQILKEVVSCQDDKFDSDELSKTAIVIADEDFLFPVLYSLPKKIDDFNVTMGYPLKNTQLYALLSQFFVLHANNSAKAGKNYYYKDVLHLIQNPIVRKIDYETSKELEQHILKENLIYINFDYINSFPSDFINLIFQPFAKATDFIENLLEILYFLYDDKVEDNKIKAYENEYLYKTYTSVKRINDVLQNEKLSENLTVSLVIKIIKRHLENIRIPFEGKNLDGLQIMGVLETRNLDFENLIIIGMNEGVWLSNNRPPSFVSESLRYAYGLPVMKQQDAIYAYLFYRLIQKSGKLTILYNNITGYNTSGELSRFAQQLIFESGLEIKHRQFTQELKPQFDESISVSKTPEIIKILENHTTNAGENIRRFSASALNTYLDCGLKFYFKYIAGFKEKQEVEEEISPATFGTILHDTVEAVYKQFAEAKKRDTIEKADLEELKKLIEPNLLETFRRQFAKQIPKERFKIEGNRLIIKEVIRKYIDNILEYDSKNSPFKIIGLEDKRFEGSVKTDNYEIIFNGIIDRIDQKDGILRIIDYKTGKVTKEFNSIESLFDSENENRNKAIFQTFLYALMLKENPDFTHRKIIPAIYDIRQISQLGFSPYILQKDGRKKLKLIPDSFNILILQFKEYLQELFTELFNPEVKFEQTKIEKYCSYCAYREICNK